MLRFLQYYGIRYASHANIARANTEHIPNLYNGVVPRIGLEVHVQLKLKSKLFSRGSNCLRPPNSQLDLLDVAIPGSLPKVNRDAVRSALLTSIGLNCSIPNAIHFERKNYFYADMPAGYQITQRDSPIGIDGYIEFIATTYQKSVVSHTQPYDLVRYLYFNSRKELGKFKPYVMRSHIRQVQLEQDSGKTLVKFEDDSDENELFSLVDYNRCGTGLMEIVFEPDLTNHHEASSLIRELIILLRSLDTCDCKLQEGSLRVDANVSIDSISGSQLNGSSERVELKNLNSLGFLNRAIESEIHRQTDIISQGQQVERETRFFDHKTNKTMPLRLKESATDYRYVPEPSIPAIRLEKTLVEEVRNQLPTRMPSELRKILLDNYSLDPALAVEVMDEPGMNEYFMHVMSDRGRFDPDVVADFLIYTISNLKNIVVYPFPVDMRPGGHFHRILSPDTMKEIFDMMNDEKINYTTAYEVIKYIYTNSDTSKPVEIVDHFQWSQINDPHLINEYCSEVIDNMKNVPKKYSRRGSVKDMRRMLDKICEISGNRANLKMAMECLNRRLRSRG